MSSLSCAPSGGGLADPTSIPTLRAFDTPTVCNAIELFGVRPQTKGYLDASIRACSVELPPMVGYAVTATFRAGEPSGGVPLYERLEEQVEAFSKLPGPVVVVFEDLDGPSCAATFGEVMCMAYKAFGAAGLITSGTGRDLDQVEAMDFPVFTSGEVASHGYPQIVNLNVPVTVGGCVIEPGDLLHGDRNGVTTVPADIAGELPAMCQRVVDAESIVLGYLKQNDVPESREFGRQFAKTAEAMKRAAGEAVAR